MATSDLTTNPQQGYEVLFPPVLTTPIIATGNQITGTVQFPATASSNTGSVLIYLDEVLTTTVPVSKVDSIFTYNAPSSFKVGISVTARFRISVTTDIPGLSKIRTSLPSTAVLVTELKPDKPTIDPIIEEDRVITGSLTSAGELIITLNDKEIIRSAEPGGSFSVGVLDQLSRNDRISAIVEVPVGSATTRSEATVLIVGPRTEDIVGYGNREDTTIAHQFDEVGELL